jgi:hypothetical protein
MRYFKRYWDEPRGDANDAWGCSWWYFEADDAGVVSRQVEVYDHGPTLRYDESRLNDQFGGLSDQPLDLGEFAGFEIPCEEFERVWGTGG